MTKFKKKPLVDTNAAETGVRIECRRNGQLHGAFTVRYLATHLQTVEKELEKKRRIRARELRVKELDTRDAVRVAAEAALIDWDAIEDSEGEPVPYSQEDAREFFSDEDNFWMAMEVALAAGNTETFMPDEFDVAGN